MKLIDRINEIESLKIPHTAEGGNTLNKFKPGNSLVYQVYENIPEIKFLNFPQEYRPFNLNSVLFTINRGKRYFEALAKIKGNETKPEYFTKKDSQFFNKMSIELHGLYNPQSDMTHYFILPSNL